MNLVRLAAAAALILAQGAAAAADPPTAGSKADPSKKKICRSSTDIGTRLGGKSICRTAAEWAELRADSRRTVENIQQGPSICAPPKQC